MWVIFKTSILIDPDIVVQKTPKNTKPENSWKLFIELRSDITNRCFPFWNIEDFVMWNSGLKA